MEVSSAGGDDGDIDGDGGDSAQGSLSLRKQMNFRKISERPLPPPPAPFSENFIAIFSANRLRRH